MVHLHQIARCNSTNVALKATNPFDGVFEMMMLQAFEENDYLVDFVDSGVELESSFAEWEDEDDEDEGDEEEEEEEEEDYEEEEEDDEDYDEDEEEEEIDFSEYCWLNVPDYGFDTISYTVQGDDATSSAPDFEDYSYEDIFDEAYPDVESVIGALEDTGLSGDYYEYKGKACFIAIDEDDFESKEDLAEYLKDEIPEGARKITLEEAAKLICKGGIVCDNF